MRDTHKLVALLIEAFGAINDYFDEAEAGMNK